MDRATVRRFERAKVDARKPLREKYPRVLCTLLTLAIVAGLGFLLWLGSARVVLP